MIDIFSTRVMLAAMEQMFTPARFLRDTFFRGETRSNSEYVDIDVVKGKRRLAPFCSPLIEGKVVDRLGFTTNTYQPPYIKQKKVTTAADVLKRQAGETIYGADRGPQQRAQEILGADLVELMEMIDRREEWMCANILDTGKVTCTGDGLNVVIDFGLAGTHKITLTGADLWSATTSNPILDLRTWKRLIQKDSGLNPNIVLMGASVIGPFLDHAKTKDAYNMLKVDRGAINPQQLPGGVTYWGFLKDIACDFYTYDEWYLDDSQVLQPLVPDKKVWMIASGARAGKHYGAIKDLDALAAVPRFPKSWTVPDPSARFVMVQSAPIMAFHQVDGLVSAQVLA
jgi:hypothetical protein